MDLKLELVLIPVSDVDRAKAFYTEKVGFHLDVDHRAGDNFRVVQMTPPGSACSISVGVGITDAAPGSVRGLHLVVSDIEAARNELVSRDVPVSDLRYLGPEGWTVGADPRAPRLPIVRGLQGSRRQHLDASGARLQARGLSQRDIRSSHRPLRKTAGTGGANNIITPD